MEKKQWSGFVVSVVSPHFHITEKHKIKLKPTSNLMTYVRSKGFGTSKSAAWLITSRRKTLEY